MDGTGDNHAKQNNSDSDKYSRFLSHVETRLKKKKDDLKVIEGLLGKVRGLGEGGREGRA
jgi:hypothetical protein